MDLYILVEMWSKVDRVWSVFHHHDTTSALIDATMIKISILSTNMQS